MAVNNIDAIDFIESKVDLDSYSSTNGFLGYCNSKIGWGAEECIKALLDIINSLVPDEIAVSSLRVYGDLAEHTDLYELSLSEERIRNSLVDTKIILNVKATEEDDSFHFQGKVTNDLLHDLVMYQTSIGEVSYHVFITNHQQEFIIYPHDDCGLGFIYCGNEPLTLARERIKIFANKYQKILDFNFRN